MARENSARLAFFFFLVGPAALFARAAPTPSPATLRVCVYYDAGPDASYQNGLLHAIMFENLLGHFKEVVTVLTPTHDYRSADLTHCDRAAYIASLYDAPLTTEFLGDVARYTKPFLWANYNIGQLQTSMGQDAFTAKTGFIFDDVTAFDVGASTKDVPGFFRFFDYKGARLSKLFYRTPEGGIISSPDIGLVKAVSAIVLSTAVHNGGGQTTPYVTENHGFYYVADNPFLFIHERDRYLIFADVLFDFLRLPPRGSRHYALIRLEDIHPTYDLRLLATIVGTLQKHGVPFNLSIIPKFVPAGDDEEARAVDLTRRPGFVAAIKSALRDGGTVLLHGYTHDVSGRADCPSLGSGFDYEFWDRCRSRPRDIDSTAFALERIRKATALLEAAGLPAQAWVTPHYAASPDDYKVFAERFDRTIQRVTYSVGWGKGETPIFVSQFFPYTIYKDHYGQFVWPENLGFVPMPGSQWNYAVPPDIAESARLSRVVRDGWASFFWHPQLVAVPGEIERLEATIAGIRAAGFEFVPLQTIRLRGD